MAWTAFGILTAIGFISWLIGLRGRRVGTEPVCRRCGFDLRGKPESSSRCAECGAVLSDKHAITIGRKIRRRGLLWTGFILFLLGGCALTLQTYVSVKSVDLHPYMTTSMLINRVDVDAPDYLATKELRTRVSGGRLSESQGMMLVERLITRHEDRAATWAIEHHDVLAEALNQYGVTAGQLERLTVSMFQVRYKAESKVSYDDHFGHMLDVDFGYSEFRPLRNPRDIGSLIRDWPEVEFKIVRSSLGPHLLDETLALGDGLTGVVTGHQVKDAAPGKYKLNTVLQYDVTMRDVPSGGSKVSSTRFTREIQQEVELLPEGVSSADFVDAEKLASAMRDALPTVFLARDAQELVVGLRIQRPPANMAMKAQLSQGMLSMYLGRGVNATPTTNGWVIFRLDDKRFDASKPMTLHLVHDDELVESDESKELFWGAPLAWSFDSAKPLDVETFFTTDESMRAAVEAAIGNVGFVRKGDNLFVTVEVKGPPTELWLGIVLRQNGKEYSLDTDYDRRTAAPGKSEPLKIKGRNWTRKRDFAPGSKVDVVLRPRVDEALVTLHGKPGLRPKVWGGEIVIRDVVVP